MIGQFDSENIVLPDHKQWSCKWNLKWKCSDPLDFDSINFWTLLITPHVQITTLTAINCDFHSLLIAAIYIIEYRTITYHIENCCQ